MNAKVWIIIWFTIVFLMLGICGFLVYSIDPFFHYHKPKTEKYFYPLDNERSQNDGIYRNFDFDTMIIGTSMIQNFRTSEIDKAFGCKSIKTAYSGAPYKEINENIRRALSHNPKLKRVIRCVDMDRFYDKWDSEPDGFEKIPRYLLDDNPFNDVEYIFNRDVVFKRVYSILQDTKNEWFKPGITSFDEYGRWQYYFTFGINKVAPNGVVSSNEEQLGKYEFAKDEVNKNIVNNLVSVAKQHPDVEFYYFYPPYSALFWNYCKDINQINIYFGLEEYITELLLSCDNIHLFSFNFRTDITTDINNYTDKEHFATWINSLIIKWMSEGKYELTKENYKERLQEEYDFYTKFDFSSLNGQEDYEADYYAGAILNKELTGVDPLDILQDDTVNVTLLGATYITDGTTKKAIEFNDYYFEGDTRIELPDVQQVGIEFEMNLEKGYNYFGVKCFKESEQAQFMVCAIDSEGNVIDSYTLDSEVEVNSSKQVIIDLSTINDTITITINGKGCQASELLFY